MALLAIGVVLLPGVVAAQTEWVDYPANPVMVAGGSGEWDAVIYVNTVVLVDGTYHLYYMGQAEGPLTTENWNIGHATSPDGTTWVKDPANPVVARGADGEWDSGGVGVAAVIHDGTEFRMWFNGDDGEVAAVGYATSPDGTTWTKYEANPVMSAGPAGNFDDYGVWPGTVIYDGETYKMWYTADRDLDGLFWTIGYAESLDGLEWTRFDEPVIEADTPVDAWLAYAPTVLFDGSIYRMWYAGSPGAGTFRICYAESEDGVVWTKYWDNPVVVPNGFDFSSVLYDEDEDSYKIWATYLPENSIRFATSSCCSTVYASLIPAAAFAAGAEGSFYETDLDLSNADDEDVEYFFSWLPRGENNSDPVQSDTFTLDAGKSVRYGNVLAEVFDLEPDSFGALLIEATSADLHAMARIANAPQEPDAGSFGQALTAIEPCDCTGLDVKRRLLFGTEHAEMRFNVGCVNFGDKAARVGFELYRSDGTLLGSESLIIMPWGNDQLNRIFDPYHPVTGYVDYWSDLPGGNVYCHGSVLDNVTSDPTTIPPM
jgi:predicted GH43/DUF377 family glycosyl hydrolase